MARGRKRFARKFKEYSRKKEDAVPAIPGFLGTIANGEEVVEVNRRPGFVWVRLRGQFNEVIQAYNAVVSPVYDLPVLVVRDKLDPTRYRIQGRDIVAYSNWGVSAYLPKHGNQHSFIPGGGGDVVWVYDQQIMPLNAYPSGTGAGNVLIYPYSYYFNDRWYTAGGTGTSDLLGLKPGTGSQARMVLVYLNVVSGNPEISAGSLIDSTVTGKSQLLPFVPGVSDPLTQIPIAAVRLVTGTSRVRWENLYDLRPFFQVSASGSSGGSASDQVKVSADDVSSGYLEDKLAAGSNISLDVLNPGGNEQVRITAEGGAGGSGATTFLELTDTPGSYVGQVGKVPYVEEGETSLGFLDLPITGTVRVSGDDTNQTFLENKLQAGSNITLAVVNPGGDEKVEISAAGGAGGGTAFSGARRYLVSPQSLTQSTWNNIEFHRPNGEEDFDTGDYFQSGTSPNSDIDPPEAGYYHVYGQIWFDGGVPTGTYVQLGLWFGGTSNIRAQEIDGYFDDGSLDRTLFVATDIYLLDTDTVRLRVFTDASGVTAGSGTSRSFFGIHRISPPSTFSGVKVYRTSSQTINNGGTGTAVEFQGEAHDSDNFWDSGQNTRIVVPSDGYYHLVGSVGWEQNNTGYRDAWFRINGTGSVPAKTIDEPIPSNTRHIKVISDIYLSAGDYVELYVFQNSGGNTTLIASTGEDAGSQTFASAHFLGS